MPSRMSLSILAAFFGAAIFYFLVYYHVLPVAQNKSNPITDIIVAICGIAVAVGWIRIFRRRPAPAAPDSTD